MPIATSFTRLLGVRHPIALAAMDLVADARLTLAVSDAGGFGFLGAGYGDAAWLDRELAILAGSGRAGGSGRAEDSGRAERGPFGIGFITWSLARHPELLDRALAAKPKAVWLSFGDPEPFVRPIKDAGALVVCQVQTVQMAVEAVSKGADVVIAQGTEAGGHGMSCGSVALLPAVVDAVGSKVPVLLAGGIADGRGLAAALMLGAQGVVMGTRFYASQDAAGSSLAKQRIVQASGADTLRSIVFDISRRNIWPAPYTGRCLANKHTERWHGRELELMRRADALDAFARARQDGDYDTAPVIAGEAAALINDIPSAAEIIHRMTAEAERLLLAAPQLARQPEPRAAAS
jgi:nitronate monooxygenase